VHCTHCTFCVSLIVENTCRQRSTLNIILAATGILTAQGYCIESLILTLTYFISFESGPQLAAYASARREHRLRVLESRTDSDSASVGGH